MFSIIRHFCSDFFVLTFGLLAYYDNFLILLQLQKFTHIKQGFEARYASNHTFVLS